MRVNPALFRRLTVVLAIGVCTAMAVAAGITNVDRGRMEDVLNIVSKDVQKAFYDPKLKGLDWKALTQKAHQQIQNAQNTGEMISAIYALVYQLNDSHTVFLPPGRTEKAVYGFEAKPFGKDILVYKLAKNGPAEKAGLQLGDKLLGVNNFAVTRNNLFTMMRYFQVLNPATEMDVQIARSGDSTTIKIPTKLEPKWASLQFNTWTFNEVRQQLDSGEHLYEENVYENSVGYLKLRSFMARSEDIRSALRKVKDSRALIIDLRDNPGGSLKALTALAGSLVSKPYEMGQMAFRDKSQPIKVNPEEPSIAAPVFVLVDSSSASASEMFARSLQIQNRATVIGDRTSGRVNVADVFSESIGVEFKVPFAVEIAVARAVMSNGEELEGKGVIPDDICIPSADDVHNKKDPCLEHALSVAKRAVLSDPAGRQP